MTETPEMKEFLEKIEVEKELLSTMPKNNEKNKNKYLEKIKDIEIEYKKQQEEIKKNLEKRYKKETNIDESKDIANLDIRIKTVENVLGLISDEKTAYEKMGLDKIIYRIGKFYKDNLENINIQTENAINKFVEVGIDLQPSDFNYSIFVEQYMNVFFKERKKQKTDLSKLKAKFEEVYWKCPDIIVHIELNLKNIYLQKQSQIEKYYEKEQILKQWGKTPKEIRNSYFEIATQRKELIRKDKKRLLDEFLNGKLDVKNYTPEKIQKNYEKILSTDMIEKISTNEKEIRKSILELLNSLYEYKNYLNFKFIIDDMKKYYQEKEKYKKAYDDTKKKISEEEKKLKKLNKKSMGRFFKRDKQEMKQSAEQNHIILELKKMYNELDLNKFYNKIYTNLRDDSTIYDALNLANSYYIYLTNCIIENNKTITQEKIDIQIKELDTFLKEPSNNIINNLTFIDDKDIAMIIKDRYQLLNFNIKQEDLNGKNIENMIMTLEDIITNFYLKDAQLEIAQIEELLRIKKILQ